LTAERLSARRLTTAELHIALALAEGPAHGYLLMHRVATIGDRAEVGAATMYRSLRRLLSAGLVEQAAVAPGQDERRRPYRLTDQGLRALAAEGRRMAALVGEAVARGVPERFHTITPQLVVSDANAAITFYRDAFDARELERKLDDNGRVIHAELSIGDSLLLVHDDFSDLGGPAAPEPGSAGITIHLYLPDPDAAFDRAIAAGARILLPMDYRPWGDRYGTLEDPYCHRWSIAAPTVRPAPSNRGVRKEQKAST
jgi:PhnB protein